MEWWQGFEGWAVTAGLSAVAAAGVVTQEIRHWRARPWGRFEIRPIGTIDVDGSPKWKMFDLANTGTIDIGVALFTVLGADQEHPEPDPEKYVIPRTLKVSEATRFAVAFAPTERAWVLLMADHPTKRGATILTWKPLDQEGPVADEYLRQLGNASRFRRRLRRIARRERRPVGPGGIPTRVIPPASVQDAAVLFVDKYPDHLA